MDITKDLPYLHLRFLVCWCLLSAKLNAMMDIAFLMRFWYFFFTLGSTLEDGAPSYLSTIFQRSTKTNSIPNLEFEGLKFSPLNLSMSMSSDALLRSKLGDILFINLNQHIMRFYMHSKASQPSTNLSYMHLYTSNVLISKVPTNVPNVH